jgi:uncharacterized damage-inducible protein DinB
VAALLAAPLAAGAQTPAGGANPLSASMKRQFDGITLNLTESAAKASPELYAFKPTPEVRSFGQILAHVAAAHYLFCSRAAGEKNPIAEDLEKTKTTKADIQKALADSNAYCSKVYGAMTDAKALELFKPTPQATTEVPRAQPLIANVGHDNEHYGNLVTYMRLKGVVPPSTERAQRPPS